MNSWKIKDSSIHGKGIFTAVNFKKHQRVAPAIEFSWGVIPYVTDFGSMVNHSWTPTAGLIYSSKDHVYYVYTLYDIPADEELTVDYRTTPWYIDGPKSWYK